VNRSNPTFASKDRCRGVLLACLEGLEPGLWMPLAEVRERTWWPADGSFAGAIPLHTAVRAAERDGLIEFLSGMERGRASVRLKVITAPETPAKEIT
jgi:hypothetical protein